MSETEWLAATDPKPMLAFLSGNGRPFFVPPRMSQRKTALLFTSLSHLLLGERLLDVHRDLVKRAERHAEGIPLDQVITAPIRMVFAPEMTEEAEDQEHDDLAELAQSLTRSLDRIVSVYERIENPDDLNYYDQKHYYRYELSDLAQFLPRFLERHLAGITTLANTHSWADRASEARLVCDHIRCVVGPSSPFRPVVLDLSWLTSTVLTLAEGIYTDRAFDRMLILADALQDAGCDHPDILAHCRDPHAVHVRGCWVVDQILGRS